MGSPWGRCGWGLFKEGRGTGKVPWDQTSATELSLENLRLTRHPPKHSLGTLKVDNLVDKNVFHAGTSGVINAGTQNPPLVPPELK